jgi:hypothetical protein
MSAVDQVYSMLAKRTLAASLQAREMARAALPDAQGSELLALHEAIADSLDMLLGDLAEHGRQNERLFGIDLSKIDVQAWVDEYATSWEEVKRLRERGVNSKALVGAYMADRIIPIGSRDWLNRMRLSVAFHRDPAWVTQVSAELKS